MAIDESLYARQVCLIGHQAMNRMNEANVLIVGLKGVGAEIAKNVALCGVKSLALYDPAPVDVSDLSSQIFLAAEDIGQRRQDVTAPRVAELNACTSVKIHQSAGLDQHLSQLNGYDVVALTDTSLHQQQRIGDYCHANGIHLVVADTFGLFGFIFCDFGDKFTVVDRDGQPATAGVVVDITDDGVVSVLSNMKHGLQDGDHVSFSEIEGMEDLNAALPRRVTSIDAYRFSIGDVSSFGKYIRGGLFEQIKSPEVINFNPFTASFEEPTFCVSDTTGIHRSKQLHIGFQALQAFRQSQGRLPKPMDETDAKDILKTCRQVLAERHLDIPVDEQLLRELSFQATGDLSPMASLFGGIAAHEILKAVTGVFNPIQQWMYFDSFGSLPTSVQRSPDLCKPRGSRYDGQTAVFGSEYQAKTGDWNQFLVGTGAVGCEILKSWALMGLGAGRGKISIADDKTVKMNGVNRNCLFRREDIERPKSESASKRAQRLNPELIGRIAAYKEIVGADTESVFDYDFWQSLDSVASTLEDAAATTYIDGRSVLFQKSLIKTNMFGLKGNTQVVLPFITESQSLAAAAPATEYPFSDIVSWPTTSEHTIAWADYILGKLFYQELPKDLNVYLTDSQFMTRTLAKGPAEQIQILDPIHRVLTAERAHTFAQCISWARVQFEKLFSDDIELLLLHWPKDAQLQNGDLFWDAPQRRIPHKLEFDANNKLHAKFVMAAAELHAFNFDISVPANVEEVYRSEIGSVVVPAFTPNASTDAETINNNPSKDQTIRLQQMLDTLPWPHTLGDFRLRPFPFDKTGEPNQYINYIGTFSTLKAMAYDIKTPDPYQSKFMAHKIRPSIVTTAAVLAGLASLELYKIIDGRFDTKAYKNASIDLAVPFIELHDPVASLMAVFQGNNDQLTMDMTWGSFALEDITLQQLLDYFERYGISVTGLIFGANLLYASFLPSRNGGDRLGMQLSKLVEMVSGKPVPRHHRCFIIDVIGEDKDGEDIELPCIKVKLEAS